MAVFPHTASRCAAATRSTRGGLSLNKDARGRVGEDETQKCSQMDKSLLCVHVHVLAGSQRHVHLSARVCV